MIVKLQIVYLLPLSGQEEPIVGIEPKIGNESGPGSFIDRMYILRFSHNHLKTNAINNVQIVEFAIHDIVNQG